MRDFCFAAGLIFFQYGDALLNMMRRELAIGADVIGLGLTHLPKHELADFQRNLVKLFFDAPRTRVPRTALNGRDVRVRHQLQHFAGLLPDVLHP